MLGTVDNPRPNNGDSRMRVFFGPTSHNIGFDKLHIPDTSIIKPSKDAFMLRIRGIVDYLLQINDRVQRVRGAFIGGSPGVGKTYLTQAIVNSAFPDKGDTMAQGRVHLLTPRASDLNRNLGTKQFISDLEVVASLIERSSGRPRLIVIDDFDALFDQAKGYSNGEIKKVLQLFTQLVGILHNKEGAGALLITTNIRFDDFLKKMVQKGFFEKGTFGTNQADYDRLVALLGNPFFVSGTSLRTGNNYQEPTTE